MRQDKMHPCEVCGAQVPAGKALYRDRSEVKTGGAPWVGSGYQMRLCSRCAQPLGSGQDVLLVGVAFLMGLLVLFGVVGAVAR
jgi:hypothetical protein